MTYLGVDIGSILQEHVAPVVYDVQLVSKTWGARQVQKTTGRIPTSDTLEGKGWVYQNRTRLNPDTMVESRTVTVALVATSFGETIDPRAEDEVTIQSCTYILTNNIRKDASANIFYCEAEA
jgi:hypothetical protein